MDNIILEINKIKEDVEIIKKNQIDIKECFDLINEMNETEKDRLNRTENNQININSLYEEVKKLREIKEKLQNKFNNEICKLKQDIKYLMEKEK